MHTCSRCAATVSLEGDKVAESPALPPQVPIVGPPGLLQQSLVGEAAKCSAQGPAPPFCKDVQAAMQQFVRQMLCHGPRDLRDASGLYEYSTNRRRQQLAQRWVKVSRVEMDLACVP